MTLPVLAALDRSHIPILVVIGAAIFVGTMGARLFQRLRIPQVVGYIAIGILIGRTGIGLIGETTIDSLMPLNFFALGIIGFMIGGELHRDVFRRYGKQFFVILLSEGLGAFVLVSALVTGLMWLMTHELAPSLALGIMLGAISSATAPAATVDVLWEYKTRGILTTTVFAIVALDDGLALGLYAVAASIAVRLLGSDSTGLLSGMGHVGYELVGALALGAAMGALLNAALRRTSGNDKALAFTVGSIALVLGASLALNLDLILAAMALGMTVANLAPRRSKKAFDILSGFAPPIYTLFFVLVGARLSLKGMAIGTWGLVLAYVVGRTAGKMAGARLGARLVHAAEPVRKYLGLCLFSQAGVAIGLSLLASARFPGAVGDTIIMVITATTFVVQIIGPPCVKLAVCAANEVAMNVTEEDLVHSHKVKDLVDRTAPSFKESTTLAQLLATIANTDALFYPVTDAEGCLSGVITLAELKLVFSLGGLAEWMVAYDVMQPVPQTFAEQTPLGDALTQMRQQGLEHACVVNSAEDQRLVGILNLRAVDRKISQEVLNRRAKADAAV